MTSSVAVIVKLLMERHDHVENQTTQSYIRAVHGAHSHRTYRSSTCAADSLETAEHGRRSSPADVQKHAELGHRQRHVRLLIDAGNRSPSQRLRRFTATFLLRRAPDAARRISAAGRLASVQPK